MEVLRKVDEDKEEEWVSGRVSAVNSDKDELEVVEDLIQKVSKRMVTVVTEKSHFIRHANKQKNVKSCFVFLS